MPTLGFEQGLMPTLCFEQGPMPTLGFEQGLICPLNTLKHGLLSMEAIFFMFSNIMKEITGVAIAWIHCTFSTLGLGNTMLCRLTVSQ